jgi:hypothetical protein
MQCDGVLEQVSIESEISKAAIQVALEMVNYYKPGMSYLHVFVFMRTLSDDCAVLAKAAEYWSLAMIGDEQTKSILKGEIQNGRDLSMVQS